MTFTASCLQWGLDTVVCVQLGCEHSCCLVQTIVEDPLMRHSAVLVFANKQDLVSLQPPRGSKALYQVNVNVRQVIL